jgi:hypothetical protein
MRKLEGGLKTADDVFDAIDRLHHKKVGTMKKKVEKYGRYEFTITIAAEGKSPGEAWEEACTAFAEDPGATPEDYKFEGVEE